MEFQEALTKIRQSELNGVVAYVKAAKFNKIPGLTTGILYNSTSRTFSYRENVDAAIAMDVVGQAYLDSRSDKTRRRWTYKFSLAKPSDIEAVQSALAGEFSTYRDLVDSFDDPVTRLTAINVVNALNATGTSIKGASNVDLRTWGCTEQYCQRQRYHSLLPLWSYYCSAEIVNNYGRALLVLIDGTISQYVSCSSFVEDVKQLIGDIANADEE